MTDADLTQLAADAVGALSAAGKTVATAESCTGGWIAKLLTDVAGSSAAFGYGIVSYSNPAKESLLGVSRDTLAAHGAVSAETAREMAAGALALSGADIAVAVSGIAGPDGGSDDKPVGTVWFGWSRRTRAPSGESRSDDHVRTSAERLQFDGDRDDVRRQTVRHALEGLRVRASQ